MLFRSPFVRESTILLLSSPSLVISHAHTVSLHHSPSHNRAWLDCQTYYSSTPPLSSTSTFSTLLMIQTFFFFLWCFLLFPFPRFGLLCFDVTRWRRFVVQLVLSHPDSLTGLPPQPGSFLVCLEQVVKSVVRGVVRGRCYSNKHPKPPLCLLAQTMNKNLG